MKQKEDNFTIDMISPGMIASHYLPVISSSQDPVISGRRWVGTTTADEHRDLWSTPDWLFKYLDGRFGPFTIDAAATAANAKCETFYTEEMDAFVQVPDKGAAIFLNPPFSDPGPWIALVRDWVKLHKVSVTVILPHDVSTGWARNAILNAAEIIHVIGDVKPDGKAISGRVGFVNAATGKETKGNNKGTLICHFNPKAKCARTLYLSRAMMEGKA